MVARILYVQRSQRYLELEEKRWKGSSVIRGCCEYPLFVISSLNLVGRNGHQLWPTTALTVPALDPTT